MTGPAVSVIIPAYKGAGLIGATLDSLLAQTFRDFEVIVVDDVSPDNTAEVVARHRGLDLTLIRQEVNGGPVAARNRALAAARGRYVAALDQDDLCHPERFARQVAYLDAHADTVLVASRAGVLLPNGRRLPPRHAARTTPMLLRWLLQVGNPLVWSSVMLRGEVVRRLDPFTRDTIRFAEDFDLYHRLLPHGKLARIDEPLLTYRCHPGGVSQLYEARMLESTRAVLAQVHAAVLGEGAEQAAALIVAHVMHGEPAPDAATLERVGLLLDALLEAFVLRERPTLADLALIQAEARHQWARIVRIAVRSGTLSLRAARGVPPGFLREPLVARRYAVSSAIGRWRAVWRRQTLAA